MIAADRRFKRCCKLLPVCILLCSSFIGASQGNDQSSIVTDTIKWEEFFADNYSISYPENWEIQSPGQMGTQFILFSPVSSEEDSFQENINLIIQDISAYTLSLDDYVELSKVQIQQLITDAQIIENERIEGVQPNCHKMIFTGKQGQYDLKFQQQYRIIDNKAFVLTFTSTIKEYDNYEALGENIMSNFKVLLKHSKE